MNTDTGLIQLATMQSLSTINEAVSELCKKIVILEDERNEYRRKWLEAINSNDKKLLSEK